MKTVIDTTMDISPNEQALLEMLKRGDNKKAYKFLRKVQPNSIKVQNLDYMENLKKRGYILDYKKDLTVVGLPVTDNVEDWIQEYRSVFPKYKKGDPKACIDKMRDFLAGYPEYDRTTVINAAKSYMNTQSSDEYVTQADYFISKNGISKLAGFCEEAVALPDDGGSKETRA
jgi:hypothetical protein